MSSRPLPRPQDQPAWRRLAALAPLDAAATAAIEAALAHVHEVKPRRELLSEGRRIGAPWLVVSGWAARVRILADGRRQFLSFLLPGDLVGQCHHPDPVAVSTVVTLTTMTLCHAPDGGTTPALAVVYGLSAALEEAYLLEQIVRLGRLNAQERILSLFVELYERLALAGLTSGGGFELPLTQETIADALGLTAVHVNRMLQQARRAGQLDWRQGRVVLRDPAALARLLGRAPARVTGAG